MVMLFETYCTLLADFMNKMHYVSLFLLHFIEEMLKLLKFWLAVHVFKVHQLGKKNILKVIPTVFSQ